LKGYWDKFENFEKYEDQNVKFKKIVRKNTFEIPSI